MKRAIRSITSALGVLGLLGAQFAQAALPTPVAPSTGPRAGDWIALIRGYIKDGGLVLGLAIAVMGFLWIAYLAFAKFNEARQGKAEWAEVGCTRHRRRHRLDLRELPADRSVGRHLSWPHVATSCRSGSTLSRPSSRAARRASSA
jgi:integrating conjugative element membrane protein (TIGR03745 family)